MEQAIEFAGHLGWLDSTPKGQKVSRRVSMSESEIVKLEPSEDFAFLINMALECGLYQIKSKGVVPVSWGEIVSWSSATGNKSRWLNMIVRKLSESYVSWFYAGSEPSSCSPLTSEISTKVSRSAVKDQFKKFVMSRR